MLVSIIIPVYCGEQTIGALVESLLQNEGAQRFEVILVNDASPDRSGIVCRDLVSRFPEKVRLLNLSRNFGEHNAVMAGLKDARGDIAVIMDDDFQNPPEEVHRLLTAMNETGDDVVYGLYDHKQHNCFRNLCSWLNGAMATILLHKPAQLYLSSFKALNRFVIDQIVLYDLPFPYIDGLILRVTEKIGMVKVHHEPRKVGRSGYTMRKLLRLWLNMFTNFSILPLRVAMFFGMLTILFGMCFLLLVLYWYFNGTYLPPGWASLVGLVSIFSGIQLLALGMIGEYLGRLFLGHNHTPQYIVRSRFE